MEGSRALRIGGFTLSIPVACLLAAALWIFVAQSGATLDKGFADLFTSVKQVRIFLDTGELYPSLDNLSAYAPGTRTYKYPPTQGMLLAPLVGAGARLRTIEVAYWATQVLTYLLTVLLLIHLLRPAARESFVPVAVVVSLTFQPFFETLGGLQMEVPMLLLLALAMLAFQNRRDGAAGSALAACAMWKIYPCFLLLYFAAARRWRALAAFVMATVLFLLAFLVMPGPRETATFFLTLLPYMLKEAPVMSDESMSIGRFAQELPGVTGPMSRDLGRLAVAPLILISMLAVWRNRRARDDARQTLIDFVLFLPVMLLYLPNSWANYQLLLLPAVLLLLAEGLPSPGVRTLPLACAVSAYCVMSFSQNFPGMYGFSPVPRSLLFDLIHARALAPLVLWLGLLSLVWSPPSRDPGGGVKSA